MKDTKKQWARFAFYDKVAIEEKLEAMATQGWMIEKPGNFRWTYRRMDLGCLCRSNATASAGFDRYGL